MPDVRVLRMSDEDSTLAGPVPTAGECLVRCVKCGKWAEFDHTEADARGGVIKFFETPFVCAQIACKIKNPDMIPVKRVDEKRSYVGNRIYQGIPQGFIREEVIRRICDSETEEINCDVYYHSPEGLRMRCKLEMENYLAKVRADESNYSYNAIQVNSIQADNFPFDSPFNYLEKNRQWNVCTELAEGCNTFRYRVADIDPAKTYACGLNQFKLSMRHFKSVAGLRKLSTSKVGKNVAVEVESEGKEKETAAEQDEKWYEEAISMLEKYAKDPDVKDYFMDPVDPVEHPKYGEKINYPMDFTIVTNNLRDKKYADISEFFRDIGFIFNNALSYYGESNVVYMAARRLKKEFLYDKKRDRRAEGGAPSKRSRLVSVDEKLESAREAILEPWYKKGNRYGSGPSVFNTHVSAIMGKQEIAKENKNLVEAYITTWYKRKRESS